MDQIPSARWLESRVLRAEDPLLRVRFKRTKDKRVLSPVSGLKFLILLSEVVCRFQVFYATRSSNALSTKGKICNGSGVFSDPAILCSNEN